MEKKGLYDGVRRAPLTKEDKFGSVYLGDMGLSGDTGDVEEGFTSVIEENRNDDLKLMVDVLFALLIMVVWAVAMLLIAYSDFTEEHSLEQLLSYFIATLIAAEIMSRFLQPVPKWRVSCIIGYRGVGKSTIASSYVEGKFYHHYDPTVESILYKNINVKGTDYTMKIIDTAGQDEYSLFPPAYAHNVHGYLLVFSIDNKMSFNVAKITYDKLLEQTGNIIPPMILVGNKSDLQEDRVVSVEEGKELAKYMKCPYVEMSAKHISEVDNLFEYLLELIALDNPHLNPQHPTEGADGGDDKNKKCTIS